MRNFLRNLAFKFSRFMYGRNGNDTLNTFLLIASVICSLLSSFRPLIILYPVSSILLIYMLFRFFSKNLEKRRKENAKFFEFKMKAISEFNLLKRKWQDRKTHRYYKCPNCKKSLRVPKGRGKIQISCPKCSLKFIRKT